MTAALAHEAPPLRHERRTQKVTLNDFGPLAAPYLILSYPFRKFYLVGISRRIG